MWRSRFVLGPILGFLFLLKASGAVHYVDANSPSPTAPYSSWTTAATSIQDAVDVATAGDEVLVTNGVYLASTRTSPDGLTNRVVVTNAVALQSVNGAAVTTISGGNSVRCVYLGSGASLAGFTMTKGNATNGYGGGVYCASTNAQVNSCVINTNWAKFGGGIYSGTVSNCTISSNSVPFSGTGGGAYNSTLLGCTISRNQTFVNGGSGAGAVGGFLANCTINNNTCNGSGATVGGGVSGSVLTNCTLSGNSATGAGSAGGGANSSVLINCTLSSNHADFDAGGAYNSTLTNCTIVGNSAISGGGGVSGGLLVNCVLRNNSSSGSGGGVYWTTTLINCTLVGNHAQYGGGGYSCTFYNCIVYYNTGLTGANTYGCTYSYCCTPDVAGLGNVTNAPVFVNQTAGDLHLVAGSGGIDVGTNIYATLTDLDGNLRIANGTVDMGAYEYQQPTATVSILANYTNVVVGIPVSFQGVFSRAQYDLWDFGDGSKPVGNQIFTTHNWSTPGDYPVTLTIYDSTYPNGVSGTYVIHVIAPPIYYVDGASANPVAPFNTWGSAATNIQDAVNAAIYGGIIMVTNGTYNSGGQVMYGALTNRVVVNKPVVVQSANGPAVTIIAGNPALGDTAVRCIYLTNAATLSGFTLMNGATRVGGDGYKEQSGGAVWCESSKAIITNCVFTNNSAGVYGGAVVRGTLNNCSVVGNIAYAAGGGGFSNVLNNCVVANNQAITAANNPSGSTSGGGLQSCVVSNCVIAGNRTSSDNYANDAGGGANSCSLSSCTISNNWAHGEGGGAANSTLQNCTIAGNLADNNGGGGASASTLLNCLVISNSAYWGAGLHNSYATNCVVQQNVSGAQGGGTAAGFLYNCLITGNSGTVGAGASANTYGTGATLVNCTVMGNSASFRGGGVDGSTVWNSIVVSNNCTNTAGSENWYGGALNYCCTTPLATGFGNITNDPGVLGNFQLAADSPCINAGTNTYVAAGPDLAGNLRVVSGTVDLGAYESQSPALSAFFAWLQSYGLSSHASSIYADPDNDGTSNWQEWLAGTAPTNGASIFRVQSFASADAVTLTWLSVTNRTYFVERSVDLGASPAFSLVQSNIAGLENVTGFTDTNPPSGGVGFYRVGIQQ